MPNHNSRMTPTGRHRLILLIDAGDSYREVAARLGGEITSRAFLPAPRTRTAHRAAATRDGKRRWPAFAGAPDDRTAWG